MIELEPIKQIKSPSSENVIIFALRCVNYMIINDKLNGLIVLDLEWREVNRIYIGEQLLLIEAIYTDTAAAANRPRAQQPISATAHAWNSVL